VPRRLRLADADKSPFRMTVYAAPEVVASWMDRDRDLLSEVCMGPLGRSFGAVIAGIVVTLVLTLVTDLALHAVGVFPAPGQAATDGPLALATVYGVVGAYVTARLAPARPMLHAMIGGGLGFVVSVVGAVATWNKGAEFGPHWYPVALIVTALPCAWFGGWLRERQLRGVSISL